MILEILHNAGQFDSNMTKSPQSGVYEQSFDRVIREVPARIRAFQVIGQRVHSNNLGQISANVWSSSGIV